MFTRKHIWSIVAGLTCATGFAIPCYAGALEDGETAFNQHDYKTAFDAWRPLAEQDDAQAQFKLGMMYDNGFGVKADPAEATEWYRRAAVQGNEAAERHYEANNFAYNLDLPGTAQKKPSDKKAAAQNIKAVLQRKPIELVTPAVPPERADAQAQVRLGNMYALGKDVPQNYEAAAKWYAKAADQGNPVAEELLGDLYDTGMGVAQDYSQAAQWYRLSAEQGNAHAQEDLGALYAQGHGVPQDYEQAAAWYKKAADQGDAEAQAALASLYGAGLGVKQDYTQAEKLYSKSAAQGNKTASAGLEIIHESKEAAIPPLPPQDAGPKKMTVLTQQGLDVGGDISIYKYSETVDSASFMHQQDNKKLGLEGGYTYVVQPVDAFMTLETRYAHGGANYSSASGLMSGQPDDMWDTRFLGGKDFALGDSFSMSPYAGVGLRYLYNDARGVTSLGIPGYRRDSKYRYIPLGSTERYAFAEQARVSFNLEYDLFTGGSQKSYLSDAVPIYGDIKNHQSAGMGVRGSILFETPFIAGWAVGPWFDYWHIKDSDAVPIPGDPGYAGVEPNNKTTEVGLKIVKHFW